MITFLQTTMQGKLLKYQLEIYAAKSSRNYLSTVKNSLLLVFEK